MQLVAYVAQDVYLTGKPQKRHNIIYYFDIML